MDFSIYGIFGQTYGGNQASFEKWFSVFGKGSKMKHFKLKFGHSKFSFLWFSKITIFDKFSKNHVLSFLLMFGLCTIKSIQWLFDFWQCYTHNTEDILNLNSLFYRKLKWQKSPFGGSFQILINTSICKPSNWISCLALTSNKIVYSINEDKI